MDREREREDRQMTTCAHVEQSCNVPLTKGYTATIDAADAGLVMQYKWHAHVKRLPSGRVLVYTQATTNGRLISIHRLIMGFPRCKVDHVDCDPLNNRRSNLRLANNSNSGANTRKQNRNTSSKYKGVSLARGGRTQIYWHAYITVNYKRLHLGFYRIEEDAAMAYDAAAVSAFGEFARTNFRMHGGVK